MGGPRNGKYLNIAIVLSLVLFALYMVYIYRETKARLEESSRTVSSQTTRHEKLTNEFKDLIQAHAQVESQLRTERSKHQKTATAKASIEKKYVDDVRDMREKCENAKNKLSDERDSFKLQAETHESHYMALSQEHEQLEDRCKQEAETARRNYLQLQENSQETDRQLKAKAQQLSSTEKELQHAKFQVRELESAAETGQSKLSLLQSEAKEKDKKIKKLRGELEVLTQLNKQIKKEQQEQLQQYQQLQQQLQQQLPRKRMNTTGKLGQPRSEDVRRSTGRRSLSQDAAPDKPPNAAGNSISVTDAQKKHVFKTLKEKLQRGEDLTEKQKQIYLLLLKQFITASPDKGTDERSPQNVAGGPYYHKQVGKSNRVPNPSETQQRYVNRPPNPTPTYQNPRVSLRNPPAVKKISERVDTRGVGTRLPPPPRGNEREDDWPADQHTHPLEEQEEVRDLKFGDQVRGEDLGNLEEERANVNQGEKFDNLEEVDEEEVEEEEGEEEEGGAQQAFDPEEIEEVRKKEELEDQRYDIQKEDQYEDGVEANINMENLPKPKETQEGRVIDIPPQNAKDPVPVPGLKQDQNLDQKYDDYDKKYDAKDPVPVPGLNQDQNLDRKYDDYDKKYEEEEDEEDYVYKDSKDKDKNVPDELPRGLDEQQRIMVRRDIEGQQQKLVSEHDAHKREEPDFPELVNVVNRVNEQFNRREMR